VPQKLPPKNKILLKINLRAIDKDKAADLIKLKQRRRGPQLCVLD
jgi:hypothetical protein